jgi:hypothetical protein
MNKIFFLLLLASMFTDCSKSASKPTLPTSPTNPTSPVPPVESDSHLTVTIDTTVGAILPGHSADTFLVELKNTKLIKQVPVVYHFTVGAVPDSGSKLTDSTWADTIDLSQNKVHEVTIKAQDGQKSVYAIAFKYLFVNHLLVGGTQESETRILFNGDTMYVGAAQGIFKSIDGGQTYSLLNGLGGQTSVLDLFIHGSTIYAATNLGVSISSDDGQTFSSQVFPTGYPLYTNFPCTGIFAQGDTVYVSGGGVHVSHDGGSTYAADSYNPPGTVPVSTSSIYAKGSMVYVGSYRGFGVSVDGGQTFVTNTSGLGDGNSQVQCNSFVIYNGLIYVADVWGVSISGDGGNGFTDYTSANGLSDQGNNWVSAVGVDGNLVAAATNYGVSISTDGGKSYLNYGVDYGLGSNSTRGVTVRGNTIYVASSWDAIGSGGLTVITPR